MSAGARIVVVLALTGPGVIGGGARAETTVEPGARWSWQGDVGGTLFSRASGDGTAVRFSRAQALGFGVDRQFDQWHLFARGEVNSWRTARDDGTNDYALMVDLGLGVRLDYGDGRLRSSVAAGPTLLAVPTDIDAAGTLGAFVDLRPLAYVWPLGAGTTLGVVPLSLTLAIPVLTGIPLVSIQYRTTLFAERAF